MAVRNAAAAALGFALSWGVCWAAEKAPTLEMSAEGEVRIGVDGKVTDVRITSQLSPQIAVLVEKAVRGWAFEPIVVDGSAVAAKTAVHLALTAEPTAAKDQYRLRVTNVRFGDPKRDGLKFKAPHYPLEAVHVRLGARVMLALKLDESGNVVDAKPYQTSLDERANSEHEAEQWRRLFEAASVTAARSWHYDLSETINGKPVGTSALVPIVFFVKDAGAPPPPAAGRWKAYLPGPVHDVPWLDKRSAADERELHALEDGQGLALDSRFHLKGDVIGSTL